MTRRSSPRPPRLNEDEAGFEATETRKLVSMLPRLGARNRPCLVLLAGSDVGALHRLAFGATLIGRGRDASVHIESDAVSRHHARVVVDRDAVTIEDLGSVNGTLVNGEPVTGKRTLVENDRIVVGDVAVLKFMYADASDEAFQQQLYDAALRDPLTGALNRAYFMQRIESELAYAMRHRSELAVLFFDVDHFKKVNDTHGHLAGDHVLMDVVRRAAWTLRSEDVLARYGGEEFVVLVRGVPAAGIRRVAERLLAAMRDEPFAISETKVIAASISIGVARFPGSATTAAALIADADEALLAAKAQGRNRIVFAESSTSARDEEEAPATRRFDKRDGQPT